MKRLKILSAALAGTLIYVLLSVMAGQDGIFAEKQLKEQKRILSARAAKIQIINESLKLEKTALEKDYDVIEGLARKMGYVSSGDKIVKINGLYFSDVSVLDAGTPLKSAEIEYIPEWLCKALGLFVFIFLYIYLLGNEIRYIIIRKNRKTFVGGIPVYDMPQI
ncbi:MAG: septum formation initiator family protein [Treponema sp.]|nr:septum formation initiator family protein [Treponema sp.]